MYVSTRKWILQKIKSIFKQLIHNTIKFAYIFFVNGYLLLEQLILNYSSLGVSIRLGKFVMHMQSAIFLSTSFVKQNTLHVIFS